MCFISSKARVGKTSFSIKSLGSRAGIFAWLTTRTMAKALSLHYFTPAILRYTIGFLYLVIKLIPIFESMVLNNIYQLYSVLFLLPLVPMSPFCFPRLNALRRSIFHHFYQTFLQTSLYHFFLNLFFRR